MEHLKIGEFIDIGNGPQEVRFVNVRHVSGRDRTTYELLRPNGRTPLLTVAHGYIERSPKIQERRRQSRARLDALMSSPWLEDRP